MVTMTTEGWAGLQMHERKEAEGRGIVTGRAKAQSFSDHKNKSYLHTKRSCPIIFQSYANAWFKSNMGLIDFWKLQGINSQDDM